MTAAKAGVSAYFTPAATGIMLGMVAWFALNIGGDQEPPDVEPTGSGKVVAKLDGPCALVDEALLERLYGKGTVKADEALLDPDTDAECEWSAASTFVDVDAALEDYPEGAEAGAAANTFRADLARAEEADPGQTGLPERFTGLGDEAYVVYDPKPDGERGREEAEVHVRRGNALLVITVTRVSDGRATGHDRMVADARMVATAAVGRLPAK